MIFINVFKRLCLVFLSPLCLVTLILAFFLLFFAIITDVLFFIATGNHLKGKKFASLYDMLSFGWFVYLSDYLL